MASSAALLPASVARYLATAPFGLQVFAAVQPLGGPLDVGARCFEAHGVGDDQLVGVALLFAERRAALDALWL
jgi:hypothetical protein